MMAKRSLFAVGSTPVHYTGETASGVLGVMEADRFGEGRKLVSLTGGSYLSSKAIISLRAVWII